MFESAFPLDGSLEDMARGADGAVKGRTLEEEGPSGTRLSSGWEMSSELSQSY